MLHFILCDDNNQHVSNLQESLNNVISQHNVSAEVVLATTNPYDVLEYSRKEAPINHSRVYILDIDLQTDITGMDVARTIRQKDRFCYFIFLTAYQHFSLQAYEFKTFAFLVKPITFERLEKTILSLHADHVEYLGILKTEGDNTIAFKSGTKVYVVIAKDIIMCEKRKQILVVYTTKGTFQCYETLRNVEEQLPSKDFYRCHKSFLLNVNHIKQINLEQNCIYMSNGEKCLVSRKYRKEFLSNVIGSN